MSCNAWACWFCIYVYNTASFKCVKHYRTSSKNVFHRENIILLLQYVRLKTLKVLPVSCVGRKIRQPLQFHRAVQHIQMWSRVHQRALHIHQSRLWTHHIVACRSCCHSKNARDTQLRSLSQWWWILRKKKIIMHARTRGSLLQTFTAFKSFIIETRAIR